MLASSYPSWRGPSREMSGSPLGTSSESITLMSFDCQVKTAAFPCPLGDGYPADYYDFPQAADVIQSDDLVSIFVLN